MSYTTQEYVEAYKKGDIDNIEDLPNMIEPYVYKVCRKYLNLAPLEDLYQMAWEGILEIMPKYNPDLGMSFLNYITTGINFKFCQYSRIINNNCNKANISPEYLDNIVFDNDKEIRFVDTITDTSIDVENQVLTNELYTKILNYIDSLPSEERAIMLLYIEDCKAQEISSKLEISHDYVQRVIKKQLRFIRINKEINECRGF